MQNLKDYLKPKCIPTYSRWRGKRIQIATRLPEGYVRVKQQTEAPAGTYWARDPKTLDKVAVIEDLRAWVLSKD